MNQRLLDILLESFPRIFTQGLLITIPLTVLSFALALMIAMICAMIQIANVKGLRQVISDCPISALCCRRSPARYWSLL